MPQTKITQPRTRWTDNFDRPNSPTLGDGWVDGHDLIPAYYDRIGIYDGAAAITAHPRDWPQGYEPEDTIAHPPLDGKAYCGISFAGRYCPEGWLPDIEVVWYGQNLNNPAPPPDPPFGATHHVECTPLLYIDTDSPHGGFGVWPSVWLGTDIGWGIGATIGSPPELFATPTAPVIAHAEFDTANRGLQSWRIKCVAPDAAILIHNDRQVPFFNFDYDPIPIPAELIGSRLHGVALDAHFVRPYEEQLTTRMCESITYHGLGSEDFEALLP